MSPFKIISIGLALLQIQAVFTVAENEFDGLPETVLIVGGSTAGKGQFPYQISLRTRRSKQHFCGGSIINTRFLLTAAHCTEDMKPIHMYAVVGSIHLHSGGVFVELDRITPHEHFHRVTLQNDISLLRTARSITFSHDVQPIALPTKDTPGNVEVILSGWGRTEYPTPPGHSRLPDVLQFTKPKTISIEECRQRFRGSPALTNIYWSILCTINVKNAGACKGDSGGPLVDASNPGRKTLVGIVSWVVPCGRNYPDGYTRVHSFLSWINGKMATQK